LEDEMFSKIDNYLIAIAQWIVRQLELFTQLSREDVLILSGKVNLVLMGFNTILISLTCIDRWTGGAHQPISFFVLFSTLITSQTLSHLCLLEELTKSEHPESLPVAILTRYIVRICFLVISCTIFCLSCVIIATTTPDTSTNQETDRLWFLPFVLSSLSVILITLLEYLFCTTSLPPGEKERKKRERETRNMTLIKIR
jgi:hypothetical protein